jgi:hypothetical protein
MPYNIVKKGSGYKVCKPSGKCFSKKKMTKKKANAQRAAIVLNTKYNESKNYFENLIESNLNSHE